MSARAAGLALGVLADRLLGDPGRWHPVAGFGALAAALESRTYADTRARGCLHVAALVVPLAAAGWAAERRLAGSPAARVALTAGATWVVLGGTSLDREGAAVGELLARGRLGAARQRVTHLVGRDTSDLGPGDVARATVESLAENTSDAVVAPLVLGAVLGVPGLLGYRAVNTLDAMVGHRSPRYTRFGWGAARLDDLANLPGSRLTAALATALAPVVGGRPADALRAWRREAGAHPSPNAGPVEAAFAGALGLRLGGVNHYHGRVEHRATLGDGGPPSFQDVARARRLARAVGTAAAVLCVGASLALTPVRNGVVDQESRARRPRRWRRARS